MTRRRHVALAAAGLIAGALLALPANASAHGRGHGGTVVVGGYHGFAPYYGMGGAGGGVPTTGHRTDRTPSSRKAGSTRASR